MFRKLRSSIREVKYGVQAFWHFRKVIWKWRSWDWQFTHEVTLCGLEGLRDTIEERGISVDRRQYVNQISTALRLYKEFQEERHIMEQEVLWERHWRVLSKMRNWWD